MQRLGEDTTKDQFDAMLLAPIVAPGEVATRRPPTAMEVEDEMADFAALYAQVNGGRS